MLPQHQFTRRVRALLSAFAIFAASACGGGGDSVAPKEDVTPTISAANASIALTGVGSDASVTVDVSPASATVTWSSTNPAVSTVAGNGKSAIVHSVGGGSASIVARAVNGGKSADFTFNVAVTPIVRTITLASPGADPFIGDVVQLAAAIGQADAGASQEMDWKSSSVAVATVDATGKLTALAVGATTVTATSRTNVAATASVTITVKGRARSVSVTPSLDTIPMGATRQFTATIVADEGVSRDVMWRSGAQTVATVDATGRATAVALGTSTIAAVLAADTTIRSTATFVVRAPVVNSISLTVRSQTLTSGDTATVRPAVVAEAGANQAVLFSSNATSIATVSNTGLVTGIGAGNATITVRSSAFSTVFATIVINVVAPTFPLTWTETQDGNLGGTGATFDIARMARLPDGRIFAVGSSGNISQRTVAGVWSILAKPSSNSLFNISVPSADSAWVVGANGTIARRVGSNWIVEPSGTTESLSLIAMRPNGTGFAAAASAINVAPNILERSGGVWSQLAVPAYVGTGLSAIGVANDALFVATTLNFTTTNIYRYQNGVWTGITRPSSSANFSAFALASNGDVLVGGTEPVQRAKIWRLVGTSLVQEYLAASSGTAFRFNSFANCGDGSMMGFTSYGIAMSRSGTTWTERAESRTTQYSGITSHGACESPTNYVGVRRGTVASVSGTTVAIEQFEPDLTTVSIGNSASAFAAGNGDNVGLRWNGTSWLPYLMPQDDVLPGTATFAAFTAGGAHAQVAFATGVWNGANFNWTENYLPTGGMWGKNATDILATHSFSDGVNANLRRWNGAAWNNVIAPRMSGQSESLQNLHGVAPNISFAVGSAVGSTKRIVVRVNGSSYAVDTIAGANGLNDVVVFSANSAVAVGAAGRAYRWDGVSWTAIPPITTELLLAVTGRSINEVYAFGNQGTLLGYNGTSWAVIKKFSRIVRAARIEGDVAIGVGDGGTIVYGRPSGSSVRASRR